jgi:DNA-binding GntR family transcriptional regulator
VSRQRPPAPWVLALASARDTPSQALVLDELRAAILGGRVRPGLPIPVDEVAARFSLSHIPVREALKTLVAEGLVEHEPRGAYVVARLTREELAELYVVRASLETAALPASVARATPQDVGLAATALRELEAATAAGGVADHHRWSRRFHLALIAPCQMHRVGRRGAGGGPRRHARRLRRPGHRRPDRAQRSPLRAPAGRRRGDPRRGLSSGVRIYAYGHAWATPAP